MSKMSIVNLRENTKKEIEQSGLENKTMEMQLSLKPFLFISFSSPVL